MEKVWMTERVQLLLSRLDPFSNKISFSLGRSCGARLEILNREAGGGAQNL